MAFAGILTLVAATAPHGASCGQASADPGSAPSDPARRALASLRQASGGGVDVVLARGSRLAAFVRTARGREIPAPGDTPRERAMGFLQSHGAAFGVPDAGSLRVVGQARDRLGIDHVRMQLLHRGLPVIPAEVVVHLRGAGVSAVSAKAVEDLRGLDTTPTVTSEGAARIVSAFLAKRYAGRDLELVAPRLEILAPALLGAGSDRKPVLAWFFEARGVDAREFVWVDAHSGQVVLRFSQLAHARNRQVFTAADGPVLPGTQLLAEGQAALAAGTSENDDANGAYDFTGEAYDYFQSVHGRDSYDGRGATLTSVVHYCPLPEDPDYACPFPNAFWNGTQMVFGEGLPLADDVVVHELVHALTEKSAGLLYYTESGALSESFSDIFAEALDLTNGVGNDAAEVRWLIGEDVAALGAVRDMRDPNAFNQPASTTDPLYYCGLDDAGGVHRNSGVPNHAFALMVDGGSFGDYTVTGIGLAKAEKIAYRTLTHYLTVGSNFVDAFHGNRQACEDLVGTDGITFADCQEVEKALLAVGMDQPVCGQAAEPETCPAGLSLVSVLDDGFETINSAKWSTSALAGENTWATGVGTPPIHLKSYPRSGLYGLHGLDPNARTDAVVAMTQGLAARAGMRLRFDHAISLEDGYDGGVVEYSLNGGAWTDALPLFSGGTSYALQPLPTQWGSPLGGRRAFTGYGRGYGASVFDLTPLAGQNVRFRFRLGTDNVYANGDGAHGAGWLIDNVLIYNCDTGGIVRMAASETTASEGAASALVRVLREEGLADGVIVAYQTNDGSGTAIPGRDYVATSGSLRFESGEADKTISVPLLNDTEDDDDVTFDVELTEVSGASATLGVPSTTSVRIVDEDVAGAVQFSATAYSVSEGAGATTITVTRTGGAASNVTVHYATSDGTAQQGVDYTHAEGTLSFGAGQTTQTFAILLADDCLANGPRTVNLTLSVPTGGASLGPHAAATLTITDNDSGGAIRLGAAAYSTGEGSGSLTIDVLRTGGSACGVLVDYATSDGSASAGSDYEAISGTLSFGVSQATRTLSVPITQDVAGEENETFRVMLSNVRGSALGTPATAVITIVEDDSVVQFSAPTYSVGESALPAPITVKRTGPTAGQVEVSYETLAASATEGADFTPTSGTLTFLPGSGSAAFTVPITKDKIDEVDEAVMLRLHSPGGAVLGPRATAVLTIVDDDTGGKAHFQTSVYTVRESQASATIPVTRSGGVAGPATVDYVVSAGTATDGVDFTATGGMLTFAPGQMNRTFAVTLLPDALPEGTETVLLSLSNPTGGLVLVEPSTAVLKILDDEDVVELSAATYRITEGKPAAVLVQRTGVLKGVVTVQYATSDGTAKAPDDYTARVGTLTLAGGVASATIAIPTTTDTVPDGDRTLSIALGSASGATLGGQTTAVVTIADNDLGGAFKLGAAKYNVGEAGRTAAVLVKRTGGIASGVTVDLGVTGVTATAGLDYTAPLPNPMTLTFGAGQVSRSVGIPILEDTLPEDAETLELTLSNPTGGATLGSPATALLTILDNDAPVFQFGAASYATKEGASGATITVRRVGSASTAASVEFLTEAGTATAGLDYTAVSGTLSFGAGVVSKSFTVPIANDTDPEGSETVTLRLLDPSAGHQLGSPTVATLAIGDNDLAGALRFATASYSESEGAGLATITVQRTGGSAGRVSVSYETTAGGSATPPEDYTAVSGTLTFEAGETARTFSVPLANDAAAEPAETIALRLLAPAGGATLGVQSTAMLWVVDDD